MNWYTCSGSTRIETRLELRRLRERLARVERLIAAALRARLKQNQRSLDAHR